MPSRKGQRLPRVYAELHGMPEMQQIEAYEQVMAGRDAEAQVNLMLAMETSTGPGDPPITVEGLKTVIEMGRQGGLRLDQWQPCCDVLSFTARNDFTGKVLEFLLSFGAANVNGRNCSGSTALSLACSRGNARAVEVLFDACERAGVGLDVCRPDLRGIEPLYWAIQSDANNIAEGSEEDFADIVEMLVKRGGCDLDRIWYQGARGISGLGRTCERATHVIARRCIELGADVNMPSPRVDSMTPLHFAVYNNA